MTDLPSRTEHIARGLAQILGQDSPAGRVVSELDNLRNQGQQVELLAIDDGWTIARRDRAQART